MAATLVAVVATVVIPASAASAAPPIDPRMSSTWAKWTFHAGGNYNLVMDVARSGGHGAAVQLYGDHGGSNQIWFQEAAAEGGQFLHPGYDRWLCLGRTGTGYHTPVVVQACDGSINQRWAIPRLRYEYFMIKPWDNQGMCVDVPNSNFVQGADLQLYGCNETSAQYWRMGHCWAAACDNQWPDSTDCDTSGADEVLDVTHNGSRIVVVRATGCHAFYARINLNSDHYGLLVIRRHHTAGDEHALALSVGNASPSWTTPMLGVDQPGATFRACFESHRNYSDSFCTDWTWIPT
ncbi:hypothetical protein K1W54_19495 [Micromonospora sp. CPCC 205371]|nr:hypothetical protein [Micromonospora sp. CPCC 205371]